jgi:hypothetical protein
MEKPMNGRIEDWFKYNYYGFGEVVSGHIYGHPDQDRFPEGGEIRTSVIVKAENNTIETKNSRYTLGKEATLLGS